MKRKKRVTMQELYAIDQLYQNSLTKEKVFRITIMPFLVCFGVTFIIYYNILISLIFAILGGIFGYVYLLEKIVTYNYELASFEERNKFLITLTQLLVNKDKTMLISIRTAKERSEGELREDLQLLERRLLQGERKGVTEVFNMMRDKYKKDSVFTQYLEQLETCIDEGRINVDTLKNITNQHNVIREQQRDYIRTKKKRKDLLTTISLLALAIVVVISLAVGLTDVYIPGFARSIIGVVFGGAFILNAFLVGYQFIKHFLDFNVTEF